MIKFASPDHLADVMKFAVDNNCADKLIAGFQRLARHPMCEIHYDFAPNSFAFMVLNDDGSHGFNGGLIYSGPGQQLSGSAPTYTVSVEPHSNEHNWSVHT